MNKASWIFLMIAGVFSIANSIGLQINGGIHQVYQLLLRTGGLLLIASGMILKSINDIKEIYSSKKL